MLYSKADVISDNHLGICIQLFFLIKHFLYPPKYYDCYLFFYRKSQVIIQHLA